MHKVKKEVERFLVHLFVLLQLFISFTCIEFFFSRVKSRFLKNIYKFFF